MASRILICFTVASIVALGEVTAAQTRTPTLMPYLADGTAIVWNDADAEGRGMAILDAGANESNPWLLVPLIACVVPSGTPIIIAKLPGWFQAPTTVEVIGGESAGCQGTVPLELISLPSEDASNPTPSPPATIAPEPEAPSSDGSSQGDAQSRQDTDPSFDCTKASFTDEKAICNSPSLARIDSKLASLYVQAKHVARQSEQAALVRSEAQWLRARHNCGEVLSCLFQIYDSRISQLEVMTGAIGQ